MPYQIEVSQTFQDSLRLLSPPVAKTVTKKIELLKVDPHPGPKNITQLVGAKNPPRFRLRTGKYRVLYVIEEPGTVFLLNVGKRADIYTRDLGVEYRKGGIYHPDDEIDDDQGMQGENEGDAAGLGQYWQWREALTAQALSTVPPEKSPLPAGVTRNPFAVPITLDMLERLRIPEKYRAILLGCKSDADLIEAIALHNVPDDVVDRVVNVVSVPPIEQVLAEPRRQVKQPEDLERFYQGDLVDLQLVLDPAQKEVAETIAGKSGAWLIKGSAGTGKSTLLMDAAIDSVVLEGKRRVLFTTYTNALVETTREVFNRYCPDQLAAKVIEISTVDRLAWRVVTEGLCSLEVIDTGRQRAIMHKAAREVLNTVPIQQRMGFAEPTDPSLIGVEPLESMGWNYLLDEIEEVIVAWNVATEEDYQKLKRVGRGSRLNVRQRGVVWRISQAFSEELAKDGFTTFSRVRQQAADILEHQSSYPCYDAIFVDEAQDLQPTALRVLLALTKASGSRGTLLCLAADSQQAIYGNGFSWSDVHPDLRMTGRSRTINSNHRSTRQIFEAATSYAGDSNGVPPDDDGSKAGVEHPHNGPLPKVLLGVEPQDRVATVARWLQEQAGEMGRGPEACAVLMSSRADAQSLAGALIRHGLPAIFMEKKDVSLLSPYVKVMTRHTAKGLGFPIVALLFDVAPRQIRLGEGEEEEARNRDLRADFVAMTRAMRSLVVIPPANAGDELLDRFDSQYWDIG